MKEETEREDWSGHLPNLKKTNSQNNIQSNPSVKPKVGDEKKTDKS